LKYIIEYTVRTGGLTYDQNFAGSGALLTAFSKWKPEDGLTVHAFVSNLAGNGGYILVETNDPKVVVAFVSKYTFWNDANVVPVVDIGESVPINAASLAWAQSASKS
jgi:hypothetical protein